MKNQPGLFHWQPRKHLESGGSKMTPEVCGVGFCV